MMRLLPLLLLLFGSELFGQWDQYFAQWEHKTGSMLVDMSYKSALDSLDLPYLLAVGQEFQPCSDDGFPDSLTYDRLIELSDKLYAYLDIQSTCRIVGTFTHDCQRVDYYYLKDTIGIRQFIESFLLKNDSGYEPIMSITPDQGNDFYKDFIYPDLYIREYMANSQLISYLSQQGDLLKKARRIYHWAFFDTDFERDQYRLIALERGFKEEEKGRQEGYQQPYYYHFSRRDKPNRDYMTELTVHLQQEAQKLSGTYDGWECEVIKE